MQLRPPPPLQRGTYLKVFPQPRALDAWQRPATRGTVLHHDHLLAHQEAVLHTVRRV